MMKSKFLGILLMVISGFVFGQEVDTASFDKYAPADVQVAREQIMQLKDGAIVFRLKDASKSITAYEQAGRKAIADKMRKEYYNNNVAIYNSFTRLFSFCKVYFIKTSDTRAFLSGADNLFLNNSLKVDTSIHLKEKFFLIAEHGAVMANAPVDNKHYSQLNKTEESTTPISQSAIFLSDTTLQQLREPFPFYVVTLVNNFDSAAKQLNSRLANFYYRSIANIQKQEMKKVLKQNQN
jgi:hypothetical protein